MSVGATLTDLNAWITHHSNNFTTVLDPSYATLGVFNITGIPYEIYVDARSMEILSTALGTDLQNVDQSITNGPFAWVNSNPPKQ